MDSSSSDSSSIGLIPFVTPLVWGAVRIVSLSFGHVCCTCDQPFVVELSDGASAPAAFAAPPCLLAVLERLLFGTGAGKSLSVVVVVVAAGAFGSGG